MKKWKPIDYVFYGTLLSYHLFLIENVHGKKNDDFLS